MAGISEIGSDLSSRSDGSVKKSVCLAILEMTKYLDEYLFRLKRNKQESIGACSVKIYLQMTRAPTRLEQTAESTEPDWNLLFERQRTWSKENSWTDSWREPHGRQTYDEGDAEEAISLEVASWSDHEVEDRVQEEDETILQELEARVNIPSSGHSTKDCPS